MRLLHLPSRYAVASCLFALSACTATARETHSLNGTWNFRFGKEAEQPVEVPHTWNAVDAADGTPSRKNNAHSAACTDGYKRGLAVYTRRLPIEPKPKKRYFLRAEGASIAACVRVNGQQAGEHKGAFTAFCHEITPLLKQAANTVEIEVDNSYDKEIPPLNGDFSMFGGLYRPVSLIETDDVCIDPVFHASPGVFIRTRSLTSSRAELEVDVRVNATRKADVVLRVNIADSKGRTVAATGRKAHVNAGANQPFLLPVTINRPVFWQGTENPHLYRVTVSLSTPEGARDEVSQPLGLRTVSIDPKKGFILNGKPMQLRGVSRHQDIEGKGWAVSPEDEKRDMDMIVDMGANALRTAHYPQSEHIYDLCDRAGLIVWSEVPCVNEVRDTDAFRANAKQQAREMVLQLANHPSIGMWGVFNEIYHQRSALSQGMDMEKVLRELNAFIKELDPARMTVSATNKPGQKALNNITDHIAHNMYPGWYGGTPGAMGPWLDARLKTHAGKGMAVSEYGHGANPAMHESPARHPQPTGRWHPEEWQADAHEANYREIKKRPAVWGSFVWNMFDFASDARNEGGKPGINDKGLVTYDRSTQKDAYFFYRAHWSSRPTVHIVSSRFAERSRAVVPVKVYSNADEVKLTVNGKSMGTKKTDDLRRAVWPEVKLQPGDNEIKAFIRAGGKRAADSCIWTLGSTREQDPEKYEAGQEEH